VRAESKVALTMMLPALVSSTKPITEASAVPFTTCTRKPTVGAMATRSACGRITRRSCCGQDSARARAASHWPRGTLSTAPRQISDRKAAA
jgi:hypothetical protein